MQENLPATTFDDETYSEYYLIVASDSIPPYDMNKSLVFTRTTTIIIYMVCDLSAGASLT